MQDVTLVFDLDGTLVDTAPDLAAATNHVLHHLGLKPVDGNEIRPFVGYGALVMIDRAAAAQERKLTQDQLYGLFEVFIEHYGANIAANSRPYDGAVTALESFRACGAKLAVCTNKIERHARLLLSELKMDGLFEAITGRDTFDVFKPDARHLTKTIVRAGGEIRRAVMVGDSETDIQTAKAAGIPVVAVDFGYSVEPVSAFAPNAVISHYDDLAAALGKLVTGANNSAPAPRPT